MKIGFEAKRAFTNGTGLGHYSRTLISSLATYFAKHDYYLFTPKKTNLFNTTSFKNIHTITPTHFPASIFRSAWRSSWVKKDLVKLDIDIYHGLSHEIPFGIQNTSVKSVVTMHDLIFERNPEQYNPIDIKIYRKKFKYACANANHIIAISQQTKNDLIDFYKVPPEKISVCYQSCNPAFGIEVSEQEKKRVQQLYQLPDKFFLYVGSIIERKNLLTICKAIHAIKSNTNQSFSNIKIPLVVIGDGGAYKQLVKDYVKENNLLNDIIFLSEHLAAKEYPFKSAADFPAIYQKAIAMIYPSTFEGFGIPVLEALWSNIPVITSNVSCMPETGGNAACYVSPFDVDEMANAMHEIATNEIRRNQMITKGKKHAQQFTQQKCAEAVMQVYQQLLT
jgi:glycosyltransferase involved in cell wall biosynthesis